MVTKYKKRMSTTKERRIAVNRKWPNEKLAPADLNKPNRLHLKTSRMPMMFRFKSLF